MSHTTRCVLALLAVEPVISYEEIACRVGCERSTVGLAVRRLRHAGRIRVEPGRGRRPNRYILT